MLAEMRNYVPRLRRSVGDGQKRPREGCTPTTRHGAPREGDSRMFRETEDAGSSPAGRNGGSHS